MNQFNDKGQKHGYWEEYFLGGNLSKKGNYINDEYIGHWEWYDSDGNLYEKEFYLQY